MSNQAKSKRDVKIVQDADGGLIYQAQQEFRLSQEPVDYQLTVHLQNLRDRWGDSEMVAYFTNKKFENFILVGQLCNLRQYYGIMKVRKMFELVFETSLRKAG